VFDSVLNPEAKLQAQNSLNELTVFVLTAISKNRSLRVLLDSVSFSRIMSRSSSALA